MWKRLVSSLQEKLVSAVWRLGCSTHVELGDGCGARMGEGKWLFFLNISGRGGGGGHLYPAGRQLKYVQRLWWS